MDAKQIAAGLKACPFCGVTATGAHLGGNVWFVDCDHADGCFLGDFQRTEAEAITAWNTRAELEASDADR